MEMPNPELRPQSAAEPPGNVARKASSPTHFPSMIVGGVVAVIAALSIWYLVRPQPLLVQGEVDATAFRHRGVRRRSLCGGPSRARSGRRCRGGAGAHRYPRD